MLRKMAWLGCLGIAPTVLAQEDAASKNVPASVYPSPVKADPEDRTELELRNALDELRQEREKMKADRLETQSSQRALLDAQSDPEEARLRSRISELIGRINGEKAGAMSTKGEKPSNESALARMAEGQSQFRAGKIDTALKTLTRVPLAKLNSRDRTWTQYLLASCHRHLGETEKATALYQQVAEARADEFLTESALWHLQFIGWRSELHQHIQE